MAQWPWAQGKQRRVWGTVGILVSALMGCQSLPASEGMPSVALPSSTIRRTPALTATAADPSLSLTAPAPSASGISLEADAKIAPSAPVSLTVQVESKVVRLSWQGTGDDRVIRYRIFRRDISADEWELIAEIDAVGDNREVHSVEDAIGVAGLTYLYGVVALDHYGHESDVVESVPISVAYP